MKPKSQMSASSPASASEGGSSLTTSMRHESVSALKKANPSGIAPHRLHHRDVKRYDGNGIPKGLAALKALADSYRIDVVSRSHRSFQEKHA